MKKNLVCTIILLGVLIFSLYRGLDIVSAIFIYPICSIGLICGIANLIRDLKIGKIK